MVSKLGNVEGWREGRLKVGDKEGREDGEREDRFYLASGAPAAAISTIVASVSACD